METGSIWHDKQSDPKRPSSLLFEILKHPGVFRLQDIGRQVSKVGGTVLTASISPVWHRVRDCGVPLCCLKAISLCCFCIKSSKRTWNEEKYGSAANSNCN